MNVWLVIEHQLDDQSCVWAVRSSEADAAAIKTKIDERNSRLRFSHHYSVVVQEHTVDDPDEL